MTGFGVADAPLGSGRLTVEVRTVNHRYLDLRVRVPKDLADLGMFVEQLARARVTRGRCEVSVRVDALALTGYSSARFTDAIVTRAMVRTVGGGVLAMAVTYAVGSLVGANI